MPSVPIILAIITLFAMLMVENANADQAVNTIVFPEAGGSDSFSALGTSPQAVVGDSANTTAESLLNSVFMGEPFRFSAVSDSTKDDMRPDKRNRRHWIDKYQ